MQFLTKIIVLSLVLLISTASAQDKNKVRKTSKSSERNLVQNSSNAPDKKSEAKAQAALEDARATADVTERIAKLKKILVDFPRSELRTKAGEMLIVSHVEAGENSFRYADLAAGTENFRAAVKAFEPAMSDSIYNDIVAKLPFNLFFRNERAAALETAKEVEAKVNDNAPRLLTLANFYLSTENDAEAKRLAARAAEIAPDSAAPQMTLGMAHRIGFHLESASQAFARALELDPASAAAKRNLADAWRGLGQNEDALRLYRELVEANPSDEAARNGLILTLFNAGQKEEAEKELTSALEQNSKNIVLQTSAAYWYAANGEGQKAVELAQKAVETEPRYVWGQIALARGLLLEKRPLDAEKALLTAKQHANFPTLDYEIANVRAAAGFFEEAAEDLRRAFAVKNGRLETRLAGRSEAQADNFIELLSRERRASIFQPVSASSETEAQKLKELLLFTKTVSENADETVLVKAAQDFANGADEMAVHRQLYAANKLLNRKVALPQVIEMTQAATNDLEKSLNAPSPTAAVLAEELYEPRRLAQTRGTLLNVSDVPRETLRQIMRGRVEEIAGWTLFQQDKPEEATVRLRRAVGVLPPNSAWWRSSYWKLGAALEASGKPKDALEAYIRSYKADAPNETRRVIIEGLYERINGSLDGLEEKLSNTSSSAPSSALALRQNNRIRQPATSPLPTPAAFRNPLPNVIAAIVQPTPQPTPSETPQPTPEATPSPEVTASPTPEAVAEAIPQPVISPTPEVVPETKPEEKPVEKIEEKSAESVEPQTVKPQETVIEPSPTPEAKIETPSEAIATPTPEVKEESQTEPTPEEVKPVETTVKTETKPEETTPPTVEPTPEIKPETETKSESNPQTLAVTEVKSPDETKDVRPDTAEAPALTAIKKSEPQVSEEESALNRPRVVIRNINEPAANSESKTTEPSTAPSQCAMQVNQKQLSILRNGGTIALLVSFSNPADAEKVTVKADSADISVALVPDEDKTSNRRVFQITSMNEFTKTYTLFVESPCGKEEVKVRVR